MKKQRFFIYHPEKCFGCNGCVAACANSNKTSGIVYWRKVHKIPPYDGDNKTYYLSLSCNHCVKPACAIACPTNSLIKREADGVVIHNAETCLGCRYCEMACPYGAIRWNPKTEIINKCNFCADRLDENRKPACIETCFAGAIEETLLDQDDELPPSLNTFDGFEFIEKLNPSIRFISKESTKQRIGSFPPTLSQKEDNQKDE